MNTSPHRNDSRDTHSVTLVRKCRALVYTVAFVSISLGAAAQLPPPPPPPPPQGLPPVPYPAENVPSEAKRVLGKILFWDEQLSSDDTVSCGTCHRPAFAGADPRLGQHPGADGQFGTADDVIGSPGVVRRNALGIQIPDSVFGFSAQVTGRTAQSYFAAMFADDNFWDGRAASTFVNPEDGFTVAIQNGGGLESQAVGPILSSVEMAHDGRTWDDVRAKLQTVTPLLMAMNIPQDMQEAMDAAPSYSALFATAFGDPAINSVRIAKTIATYERSLVADQTPWDLFIAGNQNALTPFQRQGWDFLRESTACLRCHRPPLFTDDNFHNIGLRPSVEDLGREAITGNTNHRGEFKTPSLRNVGLRDSLMHVGWITGVQDAIDFYNAGTQNTGHTQFTRDQSNIPGRGPIDRINQINVPVVTRNGFPAQAAIVDFLTNGLTDPRAASETFPFDRPVLMSETVPVAVVNVNFDYDGPENGGITTPFDSVQEGLVHVEDGGTIRIAAGSGSGSLTIDQAVTLSAQNGTVVLGAAQRAVTPSSGGFISPKRR